MWERLVTCVPNEFHIYLKFKVNSFDEEFLNTNTPWLNKISLMVYKKTWSHRVLLDMLDRMRLKPDLIFIDIFTTLSNLLSQGVKLDLDGWITNLEKHEEDYLKEEEKTKELILSQIQEKLYESEELNKQDQEISNKCEDITLMGEKDKKKSEIKEEEEEIDDYQPKLISEIGKHLFGAFNIHYYLLQAEQINILDYIIDEQEKDILDLNNLIKQQKVAEERLTEMLIKNWKEILAKIKEAQNEIIIPSELLDSDYVFVPKHELKSFAAQLGEQKYDLYTIPNLVRPNSTPKLKQEKKKTFEDWKMDLEQVKCEKENWKNENLLYKKRINRFKEDIYQVTKGALLNWIRDMDYDKIQKEINNGRIRLLNYDKEMQEDRFPSRKRGRIQGMVRL
jgi:hypothetical protein